MSDQITLTLSHQLSEQARQLAASRSQSVEQVLIEYLQALSLPDLSPDQQSELDALQHLSDDALWTIAGEQLPETVQNRAHELMDKNSRTILQEDEKIELEKLVERADRLMLRKAEASSILRQRGHQFSQEDFRPLNE